MAVEVIMAGADVVAGGVDEEAVATAAGEENKRDAFTANPHRTCDGMLSTNPVHTGPRR